MPTIPTYPGVYIEEVPSTVRAIAGVGTSITAFVGFTKRGPTNRAVRLTNWGDYEREFGGMARESELSYAVRHFFLNGGTEAWVVRVASGAQRAAVNLMNASGGTVVLEVRAATEGSWGNLVKLDVDHEAGNPADQFNLFVTEYLQRGDEIVPDRVEEHRNLSMNPALANYAPDTINTSSKLIRVGRPPAALALVDAAGVRAVSASGRLSDDGATERTQLGPNRRRLAVVVDGEGPFEFDLFPAAGPVPTGLAALATAIQTEVRNRIAAPSTFTCVATRVSAGTGAHNRLELRSEHTAAADNVSASMRVVPASRDDAAPTLRLGIANGGRESDAAAALRPAPNGTLSGFLEDLEADMSVLPQNATVVVNVREVTTPPAAQTLMLWGTSPPTTLDGVRGALENALHGVPDTPVNALLRGATVQLVDRRLRVLPGGDAPDAWLEFSNNTAPDPDDTTAARLQLDGASRGNVRRYSLGVGRDVQAQDIPASARGSDGTAPEIGDYTGVRAGKTGLYALSEVDLFNILVLPGADAFPETQAASLWADAAAWCAERRAFLLIDLPRTVDTVEEAGSWLTAQGGLQHQNAAAYWPRILMPDPANDYRLREHAPSGAVAGVFARTDSERGVWKAPAGSEATLRGVQGLSVKVTDPEQGPLNISALNALRIFPAYGTVVWGARTLFGSNMRSSPWKYVPVRRLALYIEESLYRGTQWCVFEPNHEPLWSQIRMNVGAFMHNLFRQGAFRGQSPRDAYLVKCDAETTTETDIELGIVNIVVGFLPPKPAEFVILKITQLAGQVQT